MRTRFPHRIAMWRAQLITTMVSLLCFGCTEEQTPVECACDGDFCPDDVCSLHLELPASCTFSSAEVTIDSERVGSAKPGELFSTCETVIPAGATVAVSVSASAFEPTETTVTCETGGTPVSVTGEYCTLLFKLGESCRGIADSATVVIEGVEVGETTVDEPFVPCVFLIPGEEVQSTIRSGTSLVLTTPMLCIDPGQPRSLTMECS